MKIRSSYIFVFVAFSLIFLTTIVSAQTVPNSSAQQSQSNTAQNTVILYGTGSGGFGGNGADGADGGASGSSGSIPHRSFPIANGVSYPGIASYWGTILADGRFEPLQDIVNFKQYWSEADASALAEQSGGKVKFSMPAISPETIPTQWIAFIVAKPKDQKELNEFNSKYERITQGYFYADGRTVSSKLFGEAARQGLKCGADVVLYSEGFSLRLDAESWGIGLANSVSVVSGGGNTSNGVGNVAGGGLGWTNAWAEYYSKPWLRVTYFRKRVKNTEAPKISAPVSSEQKNGKLFEPKLASPPELESGKDLNGKSKEKIRPLNPGALQQR